MHQIHFSTLSIRCYVAILISSALCIWMIFWFSVALWRNMHTTWNWSCSTWTSMDCMPSDQNVTLACQRLSIWGTRSPIMELSRTQRRLQLWSSGQLRQVHMMCRYSWDWPTITRSLFTTMLQKLHRWVIYYEKMCRGNGQMLSRKVLTPYARLCAVSVCCCCLISPVTL